MSYENTVIKAKIFANSFSRNKNLPYICTNLKIKGMSIYLAQNVNEIIIGEVETENGNKGQLVKMMDLDARNTSGYIGDGVFYKIMPFEIQVHKSDSNSWIDSEGNRWELKNVQ